MRASERRLVADPDKGREHSQDGGGDDRPVRIIDRGRAKGFAWLNEFIARVMKDPAVENVAGFLGGGTVNTGRVFVGLKQIGAERRLSR